MKQEQTLQGNNPHDAFARKMMGVLENARDFFTGVLPEKAKHHLDLTTLQSEPQSFVDNRLKDHISDMVYSCRYKNTTAKITLLFEHKSYVPRYVHHQLLRYIVNIHQHFIDNDEKPPIIIPVVLYHGRRKWKDPAWRGYFVGADGESLESAADDLARFIPRFDYIVVDLSTYSDEQIATKLFERSTVKAWLFVQKYIFHPKQLLSRLKKIIHLGILNEREEGERTFLQIVFRYILSASEIEHKDIAEVIQNYDPIVEEELMTGAEKLIQEGMEKGIEKGTILDKQEVLIKQLSRKFDLPDEEKEFIKSINDREKLDTGLDEILFAETKEQVLDKMRY